MDMVIEIPGFRDFKLKLIMKDCENITAES